MMTYSLRNTALDYCAAIKRDDYSPQAGDGDWL